MHDIIILHCAQDFIGARKCQKLLQNHLHVNGLSVCLPDDVTQPGTYILDGLTTLLDSSRLVFIYHSKNLKLDGLAVFGKHANLFQSLENAQKRKRVIPLLVDSEPLSPELSVLDPIQVVADTDNEEFAHFIGKMNKLVKHWKQKIP